MVVKILRTPEERFAALPDFPYGPRYTEIGDLRMAHVEVGRGPVVLMLHGEPTWSFLYRRMIPVIAENWRGSLSNSHARASTGSVAASGSGFEVLPSSGHSSPR